jgi:hypothetical protein
MSWDDVEGFEDGAHSERYGFSEAIFFRGGNWINVFFRYLQCFHY